MGTCLVEGCDRNARTKGYCGKHYTQIRNHGRLTPELERGKEIVFEVEEDKPVAVKVKARRLHLTPAQLVMSGSEVFWRWSAENPIGWPRAENSRLRVGK